MIVERKIAYLERKAVRDAAKAEAKAVRKAAEAKEKAAAESIARAREARNQDVLRVTHAAEIARSRAQPVASLSMAQLFEIERMSAQGMRLDEMAQRLAIPLDVFDACMRVSTQINDAYVAGQARGKDIATGTLFTQMRNGDVGATKYYLDRIGGEQWKPKPAGPAVVVNTGPLYQLDMVDVDRRLARQSALLDGRTIDVEAESED